MPVEETELGGRVQLQLNTTSAADVPASEFLLRRARIWAATRVNEWIDAAAQIDFAKGSVSGRYAFVRLSMSPAFRVSFGQFKRAFDLFELTSSSQILAVERDGDVRGAASCAGVGGVCSYSRFSEQLELSSLDVGVLVQGDLAEGRLGYLVSVTNGPGGNELEENDAKSASGRLEWTALPGLRLGANLGVHDFPNPVTTSDDYAAAWALDAEWGDFDDGLHVQAGVMGGENWRALDPQGVSPRFLTTQVIAAYRMPVSDTGRIRAVEPVGRVSWGDPRRDTMDDGGLLYTPGLVLHFEGRNKVAANADVWRPDTGETRWGLKLQTYVYF